MSSDIAISVKDVHKHFLMYDRPEDRLRQMVVPKIQRVFRRPPRQYFREFRAVNGVSFDVGRSETVGIIGRNGSGKSTLLQMICGTLSSTFGSIEVNGRVAALLELGSGFNPEFTGRENVFLNASILGLSRREIEERYDSIVAFADIGHFINQPVKTYSSGMYIRLAFAVATSVDPDILIVDEALAVGDEAFQRKCFARIEKIRESGGTILFVSHSAQSIVQLCDRAILMDAGERLLDGNPKTVVSQYQRLVNQDAEGALRIREEIIAMSQTGEVSPSAPSKDSEKNAPPTGSPQPPANDTAEFDSSLIAHSHVEYESNGACITDVQITTLDGKRVNVLQAGGIYRYEYTVTFAKDVETVGFGMMIKTINGTDLGGAATDFSKSFKLPLAKAGTSYKVQFDLTFALTPGTYFMNAGVTGTVDGRAAYSHRLLDAIAFRISPVEDPIATGAVDFHATPSFSLINAPIVRETATESA